MLYRTCFTCRERALYFYKGSCLKCFNQLHHIIQEDYCIMYMTKHILWDRFRNKQELSHNIPVLIKVEDMFKEDKPFFFDLKAFYKDYCHGNYEELAIALVKCGEFDRQRIASKMR